MLLGRESRQRLQVVGHDVAVAQVARGRKKIRQKRDGALTGLDPHDLHPRSVSGCEFEHDLLRQSVLIFDDFDAVFLEQDLEVPRIVRRSNSIVVRTAVVFTLFVVSDKLSLGTGIFDPEVISARLPFCV